MPRLEILAFVKCGNCGKPVPLRSLCGDDRCIDCHQKLCPAIETVEARERRANQRWAGA